MKIENSVNALSTDKLLSNVHSKMFQNSLTNVPLTSNAFTWYDNYYSIADNKRVGILEASQANYFENLNYQ